MALDFNLTRNGNTFNVNCPVADVNFDNNSITANLHYTSPLGAPASKSVFFDSAELIQAATDAGENAAAFLATFKAILEQVTINRFAN